MKTRFLLLCLSLSLLADLRAESDIAVPIAIPWIGQTVDPSGGWRAVRGIGGNFQTGELSASEVLSSACNQQICLAKTPDGIFTISTILNGAAGGEYVDNSNGVIPPGPAIFALHEATAWIYFPSTKSFARWQAGMVENLQFAPLDGEVLSMRVSTTASTATLEIAVRRADQVWILRPDDAVLDTLPGATGAVLLIGTTKTEHAAIYVAGDGLIVRRSGVNDALLALPGVLSIAAVGPRYAQVVTSDAAYLLRTAAGREELFLLPAPSPFRVDPPDTEARRKPNIPATLLGPSRRAAESVQPQ